MNRNGLVFVPREPPKRVILYPTQDSTTQQQLQQSNGFANRVKTTLVTNNNHNQTLQQSTSNIHLSRQQTLSSLPNGTSKPTEKSDNEGTIPNGSGQPVSVNGGPRIQNPYYVNPFFRPKVVTNQHQPPTTTPNTNYPLPPPSRDSSIATSSVTLQSLTSTVTSVTNRGRPPIVLRSQNPPALTNGRIQEPEISVDTPSGQEDNRRWAHTVISASVARRIGSDERANVPFKSAEPSIVHPMSNDTLKTKVASATDIVMSLMDTWRAPINPGSSSVTNMFTRAGGARDDSTLTSQTLATGEHVPNTPPFLTTDASSAANSNNQNWKKALVANFQKNSRNNPTAKLFISKQATVPPPTSVNSDIVVNQQGKPERTMMLNGLNNERTFQVNENTTSTPSLMRKLTENVRVTKQENNNIERTTSLQIQATTHSNLTPTTTTNKTEETAKATEVSDPENVSHMPILIPPALITAKPPASVDQQRAIITRVMIRRDFAKSTESKPAMPTAANFRSFIPPQSAKPGGLPTNNVIQVATISENNNVNNSNSNPNRIYPSQPQQQPTNLSQKGLLSFVSANPTMRESVRPELNPSLSNGITNDALTSSSIIKMQQSQTVSNAVAAIRSTSLSAANAESKRRKEELNKVKKRTASASAISNDGSESELNYSLNQ